MEITITKAWMSRIDTRPVIYFRIGSTRFSYVGTANLPLIRQYVGGGKVREHRRELKTTDQRFADIHARIENMIQNGQVPFGPTPKI